MSCATHAQRIGSSGYSLNKDSAKTLPKHKQPDNRKQKDWR